MGGGDLGVACIFALVVYGGKAVYMGKREHQVDLAYIVLVAEYEMAGMFGQTRMKQIGDGGKHHLEQ